MDLGVAEQAFRIKLCARQCFGISAEGVDGFSHAETVRIKPLKISWIECSSEYPTSQISALVTNTFFIGETNNFDIEREASFGMMEMLHTRNCRKDTQWAVELSGVANRIEVRTEKKDF